MHIIFLKTSILYRFRSPDWNGIPRFWARI